MFITLPSLHKRHSITTINTETKLFVQQYIPANIKDKMQILASKSIPVLHYWAFVKGNH